MPQTITAFAYCWVGEDNVEVAALSPADFYNLEARRRFLEPLVAAVRSADILTSHNCWRFDMPILHADMLRVGFAPLRPVLVQDTIRLPKTKGFKKGQDVLSDLLGVKEQKLPLHWGAWAAGYAEDGLDTIKARVVGDVLQHMQLRAAMLERGWLGAPRLWKP